MADNFWGKDAASMPFGGMAVVDYTRAFTNVDLNLEPVKAVVTRGGYAVADLAWNMQELGSFVSNLTPIRPYQEPRVLTQTIAAGTKVQPGTTVDLVFAPPTSIPFTIFQNPHKELLTKTVADVTGGLLADPAVVKTLLKYDNPANVTAADKTALTAAFNKAGILVDEAAANTNFEAAFKSAVYATAFI